MTKKEFNQRVKEMLANVEPRKFETMQEDKIACKNMFNYAAWCEVNFEKNLREDYKRKTTFTYDLSIAEWCDSTEHGAMIDTLYRCLKEWYDNIEFFAELIIAVNLKSWEHASRKNNECGRMYAKMYYYTKDVFFDKYGKDDDAVAFWYNFID